MKKIAISAVLLTAAALTFGGCANPPETSPTTGVPETTAAAPTTTNSFVACMISDQGGFDDNSFNESGYIGLTKAESTLGVAIKTAESKNASDFTPNLTAMKANNCGLTITVGYMLSEATKAAATANPTLNYAIVDDNQIDLPNVKSLVFKTSDAAFLAGYVAAAYSKTGTVATFGGLKIPSVTIFMDGFADGVAKYNTDSGKSVKLLGWDKAAQDGVFTGDFEDQSKGQNATKNFIDQGADVVMPVAGPVGFGAAAAAKEAGNVSIVWVDADGYETAPQFKDLFLTSVIKKIDSAVFDTIKATSEGSFSNEPYIGTLANGGVGIAPFHDFDSKVSQEIKDKIEQLTKDIISGALKVESPEDPK